MEFMDASLDKLAGAIVTEPVLKRVTGSIVRGLKFLKDELQMMHRGEWDTIAFQMTIFAAQTRSLVSVTYIH